MLRGNLVNIAQRRIDLVEIHSEAGRVTALRVLGPETAGEAYLMPGFIDAHIHIESSLLPPSEFARLALPHGTVACVSDPHEIANVLGVRGVEFMRDNARTTPLHILFGAPSCVPATGMETSGAALGVAEIATLLDDEGIGYLSEVMNYPAVLQGDPDMMARLRAAVDRHLPIDGHAPGLTGEEARRYAAAGITTDHECSTLAEAETKLSAGMDIQIREGSCARNFEALHPLLGHASSRLMFCSDDKHPDDLSRGHIDALVRRAVALGYPLFDVLQVACLNPARHYRLPFADIAEGSPMTLIEVNSLTEFRVLRTWVRGELVAENGRCLLPPSAVDTPNHFGALPLRPEQLRVAHPGGRLRVMEATDGELLTKAGSADLARKDGFLQADTDQDVLWLAVVNRYQPAPPALALIRGFGLKRGALASSIAHDSHNIIAVGVDENSLCAAINEVIALKGALVVCGDGVKETLPLPIAGLMSNQPGEEVATRYAQMVAVARALGCSLQSPFMTLSFMALLVIPELKLSDKGLFDGVRFEFVPLGAPD